MTVDFRKNAAHHAMVGGAPGEGIRIWTGSNGHSISHLMAAVGLPRSASHCWSPPSSLRRCQHSWRITGVAHDTAG